MTTVAHPAHLWGERTAALPQSLVYVFSLDLWFTLEPAKAYWIGNELACNLESEIAVEPLAAATYHVLDSNLVNLPNGCVHEVPALWTLNGRDRLRLRSNGTARLEGRIIVDGERPPKPHAREDAMKPVNGSGTAKPVMVPRNGRRSSKRIAVSYGGVANINNREVFFNEMNTMGGDDGSDPNAAFSRLGTAFIALQFESSHPLYRWLVITQFVGFGEIHVERDPPSGNGGARVESRRLRFSYDVYSAS